MLDVHGMRDTRPTQLNDRIGGFGVSMTSSSHQYTHSLILDLPSSRVKKEGLK